MFTIENAEAECVPELVAYVCKRFITDSVLHQVLDITLDQYKAYMQDPIRSTIKYGITLLARSTLDSSLCGCILAAEFESADTAHESVPECVAPIAALLRELESVYLSSKQSAKEKVLLVDIAVVNPEFRGQGIYTELRQEVHKQALDKGYTRVIGELSSAPTQHLCVNKLGHSVINEISYNAFEYQGAYPFAAIEQPKTIQLVEGVLV